MTTRQERLLDAAIDVLGREGMRRLTHRAVDARAGLPTGSASNCFRTREALVEGVVRRLAALERAAWEDPARSAPRTPREFAAALAGFVRAATTEPMRTVTLARYAVFVEAAVDPRLQEALGETAAGLRSWAADQLRAGGSTDPDRDAGIVLDHLEGLMLHRLAFPRAPTDPTGATDPTDPTGPLTTLLTALLPSGRGAGTGGALVWPESHG